MATPLLHTKLMPPRIHSTIVPREGLLQRLDAGLGKKLTLVSAPTGFGKTTLVSQWLTERKLPIAWVSLDENDNDPVRFWTYGISALRRLDAEIGKTALAALSTAQIPSFQTILIPLANELAELTNPCVLVLEDYHVITNREIHAAVEFLIQNKPDALGMVIISRSEPDLPLGILRVRDELTEITMSDLRFDQVETASFLRETLKIEMPTSAVEKLLERTEGWAAGLRLAALSLQNKNGEDIGQVIESFSGGQRFVADYLIREVFANQPENIQSFLLKTCFLNRLNGALCDSITTASDGESILEQLERKNLFLVQLEHGRGRTWYRYAPLFAESIQSLARQRLGADGVQTIFKKASDWFARQHLFDDAVEMALTAEQFERALDLIETFIEIYNLNEFHTLTRWLERIPQALTMEHPVVCMAYAQVILFSSDRYAPATAARIEPYLQAAERVWTAVGNDAKLGTALALRGVVLFWQSDFQKSMEAVYRSLEKMPESEVFWRGVSLLNAAMGDLYAGRMLAAQDKILEARALLGASQNVYGLLAATGMLSDVFYAQGDLELCVQLNQQIMAEALGDESMLDDQGDARLRLARVAYEQNDLERAERYAVEAFDLGRQRANELLQAQSAGQLALTRAARGEMARDELKSLAARLQNLLALEEIRTVDTLLVVRAGNMPVMALSMQNERNIFIMARWQIVDSRTAEALALLPSALDNAIAQGRVRSQVEALCLIALAHHAAGDLSAAVDTLAQALEIGHEKGFRRLFLDENARMAALLREILPALTKPTLKLYATTLLHLFTPDAVSAPAADSGSLALVEPLSQQETRVLKLLVAGLSNGEIARELVVSTNTIKTHVKSIYRKLDINSREEARAVAKELRLL